MNVGDLGNLILNAPPVAAGRWVLDRLRDVSQTGAGLALGPLLRGETQLDAGLRELPLPLQLATLPARTPAALESVARGLGRAVEVGTEQGPLAALADAQQRFETADAPGIVKFGAETLFDPTTYLGFGLAGKAARAAEGVPLLYDLLRAADWLDRGYGRAADATVALVGQGLKGTLGRLPLFQLSPASKLAQESDYVRDLVENLGTVLGTKGNVTEILHDLGAGSPDRTGRYQQFVSRLGQLGDTLAEELARAEGTLGAQEAPGIAGRVAADVGPADLARTALGRTIGFDGPRFHQLARDLDPLVKLYAHDIRQVEAGVGYLRQRGADPRTLDEAIAAADAQGNVGIRKSLEAVRDRWAKAGADLVADSQDEAILAAYLRQQADRLGVKAESDNLYKRALQAWRQASLATPRYHVLNVTDAAIKSLIQLGELGFVDLGENLQRAFRAFGKAADNAPDAERLAVEAPITGLRETRDFSRGVQEFLDQTGLSVPEVVLRTRAEDVLESGGLERLPGVVGRFFRLNKEVGAAIDFSSRFGAFRTGVTRLLAEEADQLATDLGEILVQHGFSPDAAANVAAVVRANRGLISPQRLEAEILRQAPGRPAGLLPEGAAAPTPAGALPEPPLTAADDLLTPTPRQLPAAPERAALPPPGGQTVDELLNPPPPPAAPVAPEQRLAGAATPEGGLAAPGAALDEATAEALRADPQVGAALAESLRRFAQTQSEAYQAGQHLVTRLHFDRATQATNLDDQLRHILAFHFWASRNIPFYLETFAQHPGLFQAFRNYTDTTQEQADREGIRRPQQEHGVNLGDPGRALARLLGFNGDLWLNPTQYLGVLGQLFDTPNGRSGITPAGQAIDAVGQLGFGLNPVLGALANISGVRGVAQPNSFIPVLEPLLKNSMQAGAGSVPVSPLDQLQLLRPFGGRAPDPELAVRLRLAQMALEQGRINDPQFVQAAMQGPSNPLFTQASQDVGRQRLLEQVLSLLGLPVTLRGDAEARIQRANAPVVEIPPDADPATRRALAQVQEQQRRQRAAQGQPEALAYQEFFRGRGTPDLSTSAGQRELFTQFAQASPERRAAMLADPALRAVLLPQLLAHRGRVPQTQTAALPVS